ncbi:hypothetical protein H3V53_34125 [Paraburkholderia bengalensis]|uniref:DUF4189 domain-containing protein n=1 Tax=Paraburkholderia bengalensis TaxID=2747562 RepID=A0ABU8J393_9BURK
MLTRFLLPCCVALSLALVAYKANAATAISASKTAQGYVYFWCADQKDLHQANTCSVQRCKDGASRVGADPQQCRVLDGDARHGWWAIYEREDGNLSWAFSPDRQKAIDAAYDNCMKAGRCGDEAAHVFSDGHLALPPASAHEQRWRTVCENSACTCTYLDGHRTRFAACVNPATGSAFDNVDGSCSGFDMSGMAFGQHRMGE